MTFRTGESWECVDDNTGMVVEQGDITGLLTAIRKICGKGKESYKTACVMKAQEKYNKKIQY